MQVHKRSEYIYTSSTSFSERHRAMATASITTKSYGDEKLLRLIHVGKTGVGKSSLGNVLLERKDISVEEVKKSSEEGFAVCHGMESGTQICCSKRGYNKLLQRHLEIIDTPGLFDTSQNDLLTSLKGFTQMLSQSVPGPHAVLFLVRSDVKFTKEEEEAFYKIKKMFKDKVLKHMVVVFTHGESLKVPIDTLIQRGPESLKKVLELAENKYTVMSQTENMETRKSELNSLFSKIGILSKDGKEHFSNSTLKKLTEIISNEAQKKVKEEHISYEEAIQKTKEEINDGSGDMFAKLLGIVLASAAFAIFIGITGGLGVFALPFVSGVTAASIGTMAGVSTFVTALSLNIKSYIDKGKQMCIIS